MIRDLCLVIVLQLSELGKIYTVCEDFSFVAVFYNG